jgi:CubicO group peptidase (beta-lactamase class C family)
MSETDSWFQSENWCDDSVDAGLLRRLSSAVSWVDVRELGADGIPPPTRVTRVGGIPHGRALPLTAQVSNGILGEPSAVRRACPAGSLSCNYTPADAGGVSAASARRLTAWDRPGGGGIPSPQGGRRFPDCSPLYFLFSTLYSPKANGTMSPIRLEPQHPPWSPTVRIRSTWLVLLALGIAARASRAGDWSDEQISKFPATEKPVRLFNGSNLDGWQGHVGKYFTVENGVIIGKNTEENAPKASTYLLTKQKYRNFRLIFESRLATSEMHSGIALWGKAIEKDEGPYTYQGHLVMYPSAYGYYDLFRRNSIYTDTLGVARRVGKQHDWNRMEILAIGHRIRHVVNGQLVADWSDPKPEWCEEGPLGLQLHSNKVAQEVQWRGLILTQNPEDRLVTAESRDTGLVVDGKAGESGMDDAGLRKIDDRMNEFEAAKQMSGSVTLIARRGRVVHLGATGKADIAAGCDMTKDTVFAIASMTKPITAAAVMILVDEGKVRLDNPVSQYIPSFKNTTLAGGKKPSREITVRDCLRHTSGLVSDQRNMGTLADTAEQLAKSELAFEPGSKWQYGPGLSVAGRVVEVASGKPFAPFLSERIFEPLEMRETTFYPTAAQQQRLARLYQPTADKKDIEPTTHWLVETSPDRSPNPSGGLFSTAGDLVRFYQMVLNGGDLNGKRVLSADAVRQMTSLQSGELQTGFTPGNGWGLGFCLVRQPQGPTQMLSPGTYGHGGALGTQGWIDPQREMIFVLLIARLNFGNSDGSDVRAEMQRLAVESIRD